jgi:hypothetical protein
MLRLAKRSCAMPIPDGKDTSRRIAVCNEIGHESTSHRLQLELRFFTLQT